MRILICILLLLPTALFAQLTTSVQSPASVVQNVLLGPGVTVSNVNYSGSSTAIGSFTANVTNFGLTSGVVITTGTINSGGSGPQGPNDSSNSGVDNNTPGFSLLSNQINGAPTYNASILEFDFIPYSDTVRFKYVFGSEEYPEYVGSAFNDVFAFFIAGPGISGLQNIAKLPNGQTVAINNVNGGNPSATPPVGASNPGYYVYNGTGSNGPYNSSPMYMQYDGFTKVLEAVSRVQCGQTYHLIIAIADTGDGIYDSGIFLEANSLTSKVPVEVDYAMSYDAFNDGVTMAEGCVTTTVTLTRNTSNLSVPLTIPISVSGTATPGVDYTSIPNSVTFPANQSTVSFTFSALSDGVTEGVETVNMLFDIPDPCGGSSGVELDLKINDIQPVQVTVETSDVVCPGQNVDVIANATGGVGPYIYQWNTGATTPSISVSPNSTQTYTVSVTDNCLHQTATASGTVSVPTFTPLTLTSSGDVTEICPYTPTTLTVTANGGAGTYSFVWTEVPTGETIATNTTSIDVTPSASTSYQINVTDMCGATASTTINYTITSPPLNITMTPEQIICPYDPVQIGVVASGGYGQYYYNWPHSGESTPTVTVAPGNTTTYTVIVSDECQTFSVTGTTTVTVIRPIADFYVSSHTVFNGLPITFANTSTDGVSYQWTFGDGHSSTEVNPNNTYDDPGTYTVTLIATNELGCTDTVQKPITIGEEYWVYIPNTFTPDGNMANNTFIISTINIVQIEVSIYNRWGQLVYFSNNLRDDSWDGTYKDELVPDGTYTYKVKYVTKSGIEDTLLGHVNVLK